MENSHQRSSVVYCGLTTCNKLNPMLNRPLPVKTLKVGLDGQGIALTVVAKITYNTSELTELTDCQFVLPVDDARSLYHFYCQLGDDELFGKCEPIESYSNSNTKAVDGSVEISRIRLGLIEPNSTVTIRVGFIYQMSRNIKGGSYFLTLPSIVSPLASASRAHFRKMTTGSSVVAFSPERYDFELKGNFTLGAGALIREIVKLDGSNFDTTNYNFVNRKYSDIDDYDYMKLPPINRWSSIQMKHLEYSGGELGIRIVPKDSQVVYVCVEPGRRANYDKDFYINDYNLLDYDLAMVCYWPDFLGDKIQQPVTITWRVDENGIIVSPLPKEHPQRFVDGPICQFVYLNRVDAGKQVIGEVDVDALTAQSNLMGQEFRTRQFEMPQRPNVRDDVIMPLHRLAAKMQIDGVERSLDSLYHAHPTAVWNNDAPGEQELKNALILLSTSYGIVSSRTCLVAKDKQGNDFVRELTEKSMVDQETMQRRLDRQVLLFEIPENAPKMPDDHRMQLAPPSIADITEYSETLTNDSDAVRSEHLTNDSDALSMPPLEDIAEHGSDVILTPRNSPASIPPSPLDYSYYPWTPAKSFFGKHPVTPKKTSQRPSPARSIASSDKMPSSIIAPPPYHDEIETKRLNIGRLEPVEVMENLIRRQGNDGRFELDDEFLDNIHYFMHPETVRFTPEDFMTCFTVGLEKLNLRMSIQSTGMAATWIMLTLLRTAFQPPLPDHWLKAADKTEAYLKQLYVPSFGFMDPKGPEYYFSNLLHSMITDLNVYFR